MNQPTSRDCRPVCSRPPDLDRRARRSCGAVRRRAVISAMGLWLLLWTLAGEGPAQGPSAAVPPKSLKTVRPRTGLLRKSDRRPPHDTQRYGRLGISRHDSRRLILYTDIPAQQAEHLPKLMDAAFDAWEAYFGPLPPDREGTDFQLTGCLMADQALFREAGLLPQDLPSFDHGRHRGQEFWMNDQPSDYYRAHLLLHEGTHCFTTCVEHGLQSQVWFIEGIAEHFATHRLGEKGGPQFRVLPESRGAYPNLGRIRLL